MDLFFDSLVIVFIDDILIYSKNEADHVKHLRDVLQRLREEELYAKFSKCEFWLESVEFLGHVVTKYGFMIDPTRVAAVHNWVRSTSIAEIQSFIRLVGYYRRLVQGSFLLHPH